MGEVMDTAKTEYIRDMAHQLAGLAAADGLTTLAAIFGLAETEAENLMARQKRLASRARGH